MELVEGKYGHGSLGDIPDSRDYQWSKLGKSAAPVDWTTGYDIESVLGKLVNTDKFTLPVNDQGQSNSCGGEAWSKYEEVLSFIFDGQFIPRSAKFIYAQTNQPGGGSYGRDNCNIAVKEGFGLESDVPSTEGGNPPSEAFMTRISDITAQAYKNAKKDEALNYALVNTDIDSVAHAIQSNYGCVIGIIGQNNGTWLSANPKPPSDTNANPCWAHWIYAGKFRLVNGVKQIGVLNSWGNSVGENGWQWIDETYFKTMLSTGSVIQSVWTLVYNGQTKPVNWLIDLINRFMKLFRN